MPFLKLKNIDYQSIVIVNIPSYMGGTKPWKNGKEGFSDQSYSDGKLEIVGFHTADFVSEYFLF